MNRFISVVFLFTILAFASCTNNNTAKSKEINAGAVYFDYKVWGNEESGEVTVKLQYRLSGADGVAVLPEYPGNAEFDGEVLKAESTRMNGFYYEARLPLEKFIGTHSIVFTDLNNKQYKEEFAFPIFSLKAEVTPVINRKELVFELAGLDSGEIVRVLFTDTSFYSRGIDKTDTIRNGKITITQSDLENLKNGPVYMEIYKEEERRLKQTSKAGGRLSLSYGLKRVFELKDAPIP